MRTVAEPTATTTSAASGGSSEELLGPRPAIRKQGAADAGCRNPSACGGNREARLGQRSAFSKPCQGAAEKAASATRKARRTVRRAKKPLRGFFRCAARDIHPRPPKNRNVSKYAAVLFYDTFSCYSASPSHQSSCARILFCTISPAGVRARVRPSKVAYPARTQFCTKASCAVENSLP